MKYPAEAFGADQEGDPDLTAIAGVPTFDACVLEFDFVPEYNYTWFQYVFCSEEYHEYVNQFNDDSGVFLQASSFCSGPLTGIGPNNQQDTDDNFQVYPIPAGDVLNISLQNGQKFDIQLVGQDGRCLKSTSG